MQEVRALKLKREQLAEERREAEAPARAAEEDTALRPLTEEQERILARVFDENADPGEKLVIHDFKGAPSPCREGEGRSRRRAARRHSFTARHPHALPCLRLLTPAFASPRAAQPSATSRSPARSWRACVRASGSTTR